MNQFNQWTKSRCWIKEEEQKESCYQEKTARRRLSRVVRATPCIIYVLTTHCITVHKSCSIFNSTGKGIKKKEAARSLSIIQIQLRMKKSYRTYSAPRKLYYSFPIQLPSNPAASSNSSHRVCAMKLSRRNISSPRH